MHFNELILNFRLRALGALTVGAGLFGSVVLTRDSLADSPRNYFIFAGAMIFLALVWAAIIAIDADYYVRLLRGAVNDAIRLELESHGLIQLSHHIEASVARRPVAYPRDARAAVVPTGIGTAAFYGVPLGAFLIAAIIAGYFGYKSMHPAAPPQRVEEPAASTPPAKPSPAGTGHKK